jgi:D-alanine-D-alanine ligase-like ATP-grasp enzyme
MTSNAKHGSPLADSLRFTIDIAVPPKLSRKDFEAWATPLIEQKSWSGVKEVSYPTDDIDPLAQVFIDAHLALWPVLFDLGYLPIFNRFHVHSIKPKTGASNTFVLEVDFLKLDFIPLSAYEIPLTASLKITQWIAKQALTQKALQALSKTIQEDVIKPMLRYVPGGQSTIPLLKVANQFNIPYMHLSQGVYQLGWGSRARRLDRSSAEHDTLMGAKLSQSKVATTQILKMAGLPGSHHVLVYGERDALSAAEQIGFPVVVKPADQDRGEGVTVGVQDPESLRRAFGIAQRSSKAKQVLVERQVPGVCYRFLIVSGQLLYVVKRRPMGVFGDGIHSVSELIDEALTAQSQLPVWSRSKLKPLDDLAIEVLGLAGLDAASIPADGTFVPLRKIESTEWGGVDEDMTAHVHPDNVAAAVQATQLLNLSIAGVDIISPDIRQAWHQNGAIINEVNFAPLLGGAEISRSYLPQFFNLLFDERRGQIPLEIFNDTALARQRWQSHCQQNLRAYFVSQVGIEDPWGRPVIMPLADVRQRIKALTCRSDVDAIVALI